MIIFGVPYCVISATEGILLEANGHQSSNSFFGNDVGLGTKKVPSLLQGSRKI